MALPFIDGLNQVLRGMVPMNNAGGLATPDEALAAQRQGLLGLGSGLLSSSGPNRLPISFGQALGSAMIQSNAMQQNALDDTLKRKLVASEAIKNVGEGQERGINSRFGNPQMTQSGRAVIYDRQQGRGVYADTGQPWDGTADPLNKVQMVTAPDGSISTVNLGSVMAPPQQQPGAPQGATGAPGAPPGVSVPQRPPAIQPLVTTPQALQGAQAKADATATGTTAGTKTAEANFNLPKVEQTVNQTVAKIEELKNHPGLPYIVSGASYLPIVAGTAQAGANALDNQLKGRAFLDAYTASLRGAGQISNIEGEKGTQAIARLDRAQTLGDYKKALDDFENLVKSDLKTAQKQAGQKGVDNDPLGIR